MGKYFIYSKTHRDKFFIFYILKMHSTMGRFRANSLTSSGSSRPSTPNNSILFDLLTQKDSKQTNRNVHVGKGEDSNR